MPRNESADAGHDGGYPQTPEGPILILNTGEDPDRIGTVTAAEDFGAYLLSRVEEELEAPR